jgi:hypothetical protein
VVLALIGLRIGEATGLNVEDLDHDGFYRRCCVGSKWDSANGSCHI